MIASVSSWHEHRDAALHEMGTRLDRGEALVVAAPALVEAYSVLTRLPLPRRVAPPLAWALIEANFLREDVAILDVRGYREVLEQLAMAGLGGGQAYDGIIAGCARMVGATTLLTFNRRHFENFAGPDLAIVVPGDPVP